MMNESNCSAQLHPFQHHTYGVPSLPIEETLNAILQWVSLGQPGGIIYGPPRMGKTSAIRMMIPLLDREFNSTVPIYTFQCPAEAVPSKNVFLQRLLSDVGHSFSARSRAHVKEERLVEFIALTAHERNAGRAILVVDDAQWLTERTYYWLMDIHNQLDRRGIQLVTLLIGQPELLSARSVYRELRQYQIVGRFMQRTHAFRGLRDAADVESIFRVMDESMECTNASGETITQAHVPMAYRAGWRLHTHASIVWGHFREHYKLGVEKHFPREIAMGAFMPFARELLRQLSNLDQEHLPFPRNLVDELVEATYLDVS